MFEFRLSLTVARKGSKINVGHDVEKCYHSYCNNVAITSGIKPDRYFMHKPITVGCILSLSNSGTALVDPINSGNPLELCLQLEHRLKVKVGIYRFQSRIRENERHSQFCGNCIPEWWQTRTDNVISWYDRSTKTHKRFISLIYYTVEY